MITALLTASLGSETDTASFGLKLTSEKTIPTSKSKIFSQIAKILSLAVRTAIPQNGREVLFASDLMAFIQKLKRSAKGLLLLTAAMICLQGRADFPSSQTSAFARTSGMERIGPDWTPHIAEKYGQPSGTAKMDLAKLLPQIILGSSASNAVCEGILGNMLMEGKFVSRDTNEGFRLLRLSALGGVGVACGDLGWRYETGEGVEKNSRESLEWFKRGAEKGDAISELNLAGIYESGRWVETNYEEAINWYLAVSTNTGSTTVVKAYALMCIGDCYSAGTGVEKDATMAQELWIKAAELGSARAMYHLGDVLFHAAVTNRADINSANESFEWFEKSASLGDRNGCFGLAVCYRQGVGTPKDITNHFRWLSKAAELGLPDAENYLGKLYYFGEGTATNYDSALEWYHRAATNGEPQACYSYALMLLNTNFTHTNLTMKSMVEVNHFMLEAAKAGHRQAQLALARINFLWVPPHKSEALRWLKISADAGWPEAEFELEECYRTGSMVAKDDTEALKWLRRAAEHGHVQAQRHLGIRYMQGGGVNLDPVEGTKWLQLAANQGESESENNLGYSMMIRQDKDANLAEAAAWLILASRQGQSQAKVNLESLKTRLSSAVYQEAVQRADNFEPRPSPICNPMGTGLVPIVPFQESR